MRSAKIIYWTTTILFFLFEGVMPALTSQTELAKEGLRSLGYPDYFGILLTVFKVAGALVLVIPQIPGRLKEWAYAGFTFELLSAFVSNWAVKGLNGESFAPVIVLAVLLTSYWYYHKLNPNALA